MVRSRPGCRLLEAMRRNLALWPAACGRSRRPGLSPCGRSRRQAARGRSRRQRSEGAANKVVLIRRFPALKHVILWKRRVCVLAIGKHALEALVEADPAVAVLPSENVSILTEHRRVRLTIKGHSKDISDAF